MMIYKPSKLIYSSVHIDLVYHFIRDHFSRIPIYTYISFNRPVLTSSLSTVPSSLSLRTSSSLLSTLSMALWQHLPLALDHNFFIMAINVLPEVVSDPHLHGLFLTVAGQLADENLLSKLVVLYLDAGNEGLAMGMKSPGCLAVRHSMASKLANCFDLGQEKISEKAFLNSTSILSHTGQNLCSCSQVRKLSIYTGPENHKSPRWKSTGAHLVFGQ